MRSSSSDCPVVVSHVHRKFKQKIRCFSLKRLIIYYYYLRKQLVFPFYIFSVMIRLSADRSGMQTTMWFRFHEKLIFNTRHTRHQCDEHRVTKKMCVLCNWRKVQTCSKTRCMLTKHDRDVCIFFLTNFVDTFCQMCYLFIYFCKFVITNCHSCCAVSLCQNKIHAANDQSLFIVGISASKHTLTFRTN